MLIGKLVPTLLCGVGIALADVTSIVNAIDAIQNSSLSLSDTVGSWDGSVLGSLPIISQSTSLLGKIYEGTDIAKQSTNLSDTDAIRVGIATLTLVGDVNTTLATIEAAQPKFSSDWLSAVVLLNLKEEKSASTSFSDAVAEKLPSSFASTAQQLAGEITAAFDAAIDLYTDDEL